MTTMTKETRIQRRRRIVHRIDPSISAEDEDVCKDEEGFSATAGLVNEEVRTFRVATGSVIP